jgi:hypothetical protein
MTTKWSFCVFVDRQLLFDKGGHLFNSLLSPLSASAGVILNVSSVFFQQNIGVLFTDTFRGGYIVVFCFQPLDDLFGGLICGLSAFSEKLSHDVV